MKSKFSLLNDCYFDICLNSNPSINSRISDSDQVLKLPLKKERISLKRKSETNPCSDRDFKPLNFRLQEQQTRTGTDRLSNLKSINMQTMASTNRFTHQKPTVINRVIVPDYSTRTFVVPNEIKSKNICEQNYKVHELNILRSYTDRNFTGNLQSQPIFMKKNESLKQIDENCHKKQDAYQISMKKLKQIEKIESKEQNLANKYDTVKSIESDNSVIQERYSESTIEIDFFNPSSTRLFNIQNDFSPHIRNKNHANKY